MSDKDDKASFLAWKDIEPNTAAWHKQSIQYLSEIWPDISSRKASNDTWGDEVECQIVRFDHENREVQLSLKQKELLAKLPKNGVFQPEFARYMIETTPEKPFTSSLSSLLAVEKSLEDRRRKINEKLPDNEKLMTLSVFPLLGTEPFVEPGNADQPITNFDAAVSDGPYSLAKDNIEARSNREADIKVSIFRDEKTTLPAEIYLNHILYGPGACGLQATFQCSNLKEARILHDQLIVLGPILLALTAATPIYQGVLVDTDARWNQTATAVDDRAEDERDQVSERWSTAPMFLRETGENMGSVLGPKDKRLVNEDSTYLESKGMDPTMASYFAHLHLRDPLYLAAKSGKHQEVTGESVHKSICASVWSHVRMKIPELHDSGMGWRVEFRPMEVQLTDFANASILIFLDLIRQTLAWMGPGLKLWMPLNLVRENMERAHTRDAVRKEKFWFPKNPVQGSGSGDDSCVELKLDQIINGAGSTQAASPGFLLLIEQYLDEALSVSDEKLRAEIEKYLSFIRRRASGEEPTPARWMREFIANHDGYEKNSVLSCGVCYDMLEKIA